MKKIKLQSLICIFCSFLICLCLFLSIFLGVTKFTLLSENYFSSQLSSSGYSAVTAEHINQKYRESARPAGIDPEIFNGFITEEEIQKETMNYYHVNYGEQEYSFDATAFNEKLNSLLDKYIADNNIVMDSVSTANVQSYKDACLKVYQEYTSSFMIRYYVMGVTLLEKPVIIGILISVILALLSVLIVLKSRQSRERQDVYLGTGLVGSGIMLVIPTAFVLLSGVINKINIDNESFYNLITSIGNSYLIYLFVPGLILLILGVLLSFRKNLMDKIGKSKESENTAESSIENAVESSSENESSKDTVDVFEGVVSNEQLPEREDDSKNNASDLPSKEDTAFTQESIESNDIDHNENTLSDDAESIADKGQDEKITNEFEKDEIKEDTSEQSASDEIKNVKEKSDSDTPEESDTKKDDK